jgi:hypothetical protein
MLACVSQSIAQFNVCHARPGETTQASFPMAFFPFLLRLAQSIPDSQGLAHESLYPLLAAHKVI